ncbi:DNA internalization-related competence protein ComEC/Rec2 [Erwinia sp. CPCC 100877]|nr:DNA internalization-related competence protein ComEC/Rec2 [Erwinia sp. CPCC 100877]
MKPNGLLGILFLWIIFRIVCTRTKLLIIISGSSILVMTLLCLITLKKENEPRFQRESEGSGQLVILPDKYKIDGDQLQLEGEFYVSATQKQRVSAFYRFSSQAEQRQWQKLNGIIRIQLTGTLEKPLGQTNDNGFDYQQFLKGKGIYQTLTIASIQKVTMEIPRFYQVVHWLSSFRKKALDYCDTVFLPETALYLKALIFGYKANEFAQKSALLSSLGIVHLFSLSGMHVAFFIGCFRYICLRSKITVEQLFWLQLIASIVYAGMTGFSISVLRALIYSMLRLGNSQYKWRLSTLDCWALTLFSGLLLNPYLLLSVGGQLSYGLSFFILYVQPVIAKIQSRYFQMLCFSFLLNIVILPLIGLNFFEWQVLGSLFTFLLMPIFERFILPLLSFSFVCSLIYPWQVMIIGLESYFNFQQYVFEWLSRHGTFTLVTGKFSAGSFLLACTCVFLLLHYLMLGSKKFWLCFVGLFLIVNSKFFNGTGTLAYIDVGQGDSIFIQLPFHRENILIDTGGRISFEKEGWTQRVDNKANAETTVIPYLKSKGVKYLDKVFISHGDADHCGDLAIINQKIPIRRLYYPKGTDKKPMFADLLNDLRQSGTVCVSVLGGQTIKCEIPLQLLAPLKPGAGANEDSMVVYAQLGNKRCLFTGDLEKAGEIELLRNYPSLQVDILKAGHHGSQTSSDPFFIKRVRPEEAIISCGRNNRFKHPHPVTLQTFQETDTTVLRTDKQGMIYYKWSFFSRLSAAKTVLKEN